MNANNHVYRHHRHRKAALKQHDPADVPAASQLALRTAMRLENVSAVQYDDLLWIMNQESGGRVNAKNPHSSARGLFQLLSNNYQLTPHGADSFGNDVQECQGGIRCIIGRYRSARGARQFAIIDATSGKVLWLPFTVCCGSDASKPAVDFRPDSALLVINGMRNEADDGTHYYALKHGQLAFIGSQPR